MVAIYWFRKGLRVHDNKLLLKACKESKILFPIFILDPQFTRKPNASPSNASCNHSSNNSNNNSNTNDTDEEKCNNNILEDPRLPSDTISGTGVGRPNANVFQFFFECLQDLNNTLNKDYKSKLFVFRGNPIEIYEYLFKNIPNITNLYFQSDTEPYAKQRDLKVIQLCKQYNINCKCDDYGHTLYNMEQMIDIHEQMTQKTGKKTDPNVPRSYQSFLKLINKLGTPAQPLHAPKLGKDWNCSLGDWNDYLPNFESKIASLTKEKQYNFNIPTILEIGFEQIADNKHSPFYGGESVGLQRLSNYISNELKVLTFAKPQTRFNSIIPDTTVLSPYITQGALSVRLFWHEINKIYEKRKTSNKLKAVACTQPPVSLHGQLYFREWFYLLSYVTPNFDKIKNNVLCKQSINWDDYNGELVYKWKYSQTGYPLIDALMTQLRTEGWIHHLGRHLVACFLTRGDLWQSWEVGKCIFDELLLDGDYALNSANWMWLSCSAFFHSYWRVYSPLSFGKNNDINGDYIRKYVPVLSGFSNQYIYTPWMAPKSEQMKANCVIGKDYPLPVVNHDIAKKENIARMKAAYSKNSNETPSSNSVKIKNGNKTSEQKSKKKKNKRTLDEFFVSNQKNDIGMGDAPPAKKRKKSIATKKKNK